MAWRERKDAERAAVRGEVAALTGRSGGGGSRDGCFKCGGSGHFARDCREAGSRARR